MATLNQQLRIEKLRCVKEQLNVKNLTEVVRTQQSAITAARTQA